MLRLLPATSLNPSTSSSPLSPSPAQVNASSGVALFPGLSINTSATGYQLTATSPNITQGTSSPFNIWDAVTDCGPCATFRPNRPEGLRPPSQLRFSFRQERRMQVAWAFPSANEQVALHA